MNLVQLYEKLQIVDLLVMENLSFHFNEKIGLYFSQYFIFLLLYCI